MPSPYSLPQIYDIAFDFRDVKGECDFLLRVAQDYLGRPVRSAIELACGPGYHVREFAKRGLLSHGLDISPEMVAYANQLIAKEQLDAEISLGDMRSFQSNEKYDLAYILIASFAHLLTNRDILDHLNCVADILNDDGLYIISTAHPRDFWRENTPSGEDARRHVAGDDTSSWAADALVCPESPDDTSWTQTRDGLTVTTNWGGSNQQFDPLTEIDDVVISFDVAQNGQTTRHEFPTQLRRLSFQTFMALVQLSERFAVVDMYGDFDLNTKLTNDPASVRFMPILKKI
jgi:SAM-dependent methyltransferase